MTEIEKIVLFDLVLPGVIGFGVYLKGKDHLLSLIITLVCITISLCAQLLIKYEQITEVISELGHIERGTTAEDLRVFRTSLFDNYTKARSNPDAAIRNQAAESVRECARLLSDLSRGVFEFGHAPNDFCGYMVEQIRKTHQEVFATSVIRVVSNQFWSSGCGKQYLAANAAIRSKGIPITRVFVVDKRAPDLLRETVGSLEKPASEQWKMGAHVRIACTTEADLLNKDFALFDNKAVMSITKVNTGPGARVEGLMYASSDEQLNSYRAARELAMRESEEVWNLQHLSKYVNERCK